MQAPRSLVPSLVGAYLLAGGIISASPQYYVLLPSAAPPSTVLDADLIAPVGTIRTFAFSDYGEKFITSSPSLGPMEWAEAALLVKYFEEGSQIETTLWEHRPREGEEIQAVEEAFRVFANPQSFLSRMSVKEAELFQAQLDENQVAKEAHKALAFDATIPGNVRNRALVLHAYDLLAGAGESSEVIALLTPLADGKVIANGLDVAEARFILGKIAHYRQGDRLRGYKYYGEARELIDRLDLATKLWNAKEVRDQAAKEQVAVLFEWRDFHGFFEY